MAPSSPITSMRSARAAAQSRASARKATSSAEGSARGPLPGAITRRKAGFYASDSIRSDPATPARGKSVSQFECFKSLTTKEAALLPSETAIAETATTFARN